MSHKELAEQRDRKRGSRGRGGKGTDSDSVGTNQVENEQTWQGVTSGLSAQVYGLALRSDGWLRFMPSGDGKFLFLKWKFTRGRFAGSYAFVSGPAHEYERLLYALHDFVEDCYEGRRRPTPDSYYNS